MTTQAISGRSGAGVHDGCWHAFVTTERLPRFPEDHRASRSAPFRLHHLRHTAASLMLAQDVSPRVIMEVLGHSQISITMNTYSHISEVQSRGLSGLVRTASVRGTVAIAPD